MAPSVVRLIAVALSASRAATVRELRAPIGLTRERLEAAYTFLLELGIQRTRPSHWDHQVGRDTGGRSTPGVISCQCASSASKSSGSRSGA